MREIKFRAWIPKGAWIKESFMDYSEEGNLERFFTINKDNFMQYTGLNDKNGKEIYEGDIVKDYYGNVLRVDWAESWARYMLSFDGVWCQYYLQDYHNNKIDRQAEVMEIIGNIYENPELLKGR